MLHPEAAAYELFGIDGALILVSVAVATLGLVVAIWLFGVFRRGGQPGPSWRAHRGQRRDPLPVPGLAQQVVVRRPQPPAVHRHRRAGRRGDLVVRPRRSSTGRSTASAASTVDAGRGLRRIQTGRVQNYALGIAIGLIVMAGSYLLIAAR